MISGKRGKGTEYPLWARAAQIMRCHKLAWFEGQGLFLGGSRQGSRASWRSPTQISPRRPLVPVSDPPKTAGPRFISVFRERAVRH